MQPKFVQDQDERRLELYSEISGPIENLTFLRKSLLFAELSLVAYNDANEAARAAGKIGFPDVDFFDHDGSQAFRFRNDHDCVITCRGTEAHEWNDIRADVSAATVLAETAGKVHRGFKREVDDLWPMLETALSFNRLPLYFCGHSLGGAMATICAARCLLSHIQSNPRQLYTYGSPRVGDKSYINYVKLDYYRFVNNNDIVTRVPPPWMGYHHDGKEVYFNRRGEIKEYGYLLKRRDRWQGFLRGLRKWKFDHFSDHSIQMYCQHLLKAIRAEDEALAAGKPAQTGPELAAAAPPPPQAAAA